MVISSQTLLPGGAAVTLEDGQGATRILSWGTDGASVVVVSEGPAGTSTTEEGLGGFITEGPGGKEGGNVTVVQTASSVEIYTGVASRWRGDGYRWWGVGTLLMIGFFMK